MGLARKATEAALNRGRMGYSLESRCPCRRDDVGAPNTRGHLGAVARRGLLMREMGEFGAEIAGEGVHRRAAGAGLGVGIVIGVGVDVVGVDRAVGVGDELDAGDADVVGGEEGFVALLQRAGRCRR